MSISWADITLILMNVSFVQEVNKYKVFCFTKISSSLKTIKKMSDQTIELLKMKHLKLTKLKERSKIQTTSLTCKWHFQVWQHIFPLRCGEKEEQIQVQRFTSSSPDGRAWAHPSVPPSLSPSTHLSIAKAHLNLPPPQSRNKEQRAGRSLFF